MPRTVTGIDIGSRTKFLRGLLQGQHLPRHGLRRRRPAERRARQRLGRGRGRLQAGRARVGLTGRDVNMRYTRVPRVPDWQLHKLMRFEVEEIGDQSGSERRLGLQPAAPLPEIEGEDVVAARHGARDAARPSTSRGWPRAGRQARGLLAQRAGAVQRLAALRRDRGRDGPDRQHRPREPRRDPRARAATCCSRATCRAARSCSTRRIAERFGVSLEKAEEHQARARDAATPGAQLRRTRTRRRRAARCSERRGPAALAAAVDRALLQEPGEGRQPARRPRATCAAAARRWTGCPNTWRRHVGAGGALRPLPRGRRLGASTPEAAEQLERLPAAGRRSASGSRPWRSDPEAYSVEILPAALRARREFLGGTVVR